MTWSPGNRSLLCYTNGATARIMRPNPWCLAGAMLLICGIVAQLAHAAPYRNTKELGELVKLLVHAQPTARQGIYASMKNTADARLVPALKAYESGVLEVRDDRLVIYHAQRENDTQSTAYQIIDALSQEPVLAKDGGALYTRELGNVVRAPQSDRRMIEDAIATLSLFADDPEVRREAIVLAGRRCDPSVLEVLLAQLNGPDGQFTIELRTSTAIIQLVHGDRDLRRQAAKTIQELSPLAALGAVNQVLERQDVARDVELVVALKAARTAIENRQWRVNLVQHTFSGLSLASILILMASGLSIIFGLMRIINMAHGEFMMLGAVSAYAICESFKRCVPPPAFDLYWLIAVPFSFLVAALVGWICEIIVVRRLYGRSIDSLLATWGISLILIQLARITFGDTTAITPPSWLSGGWQVSPDLVLPWNRLFIVGLCAACLGLIHWVVYHTRFGLHLRATMQDREVAAALGVNTRRVDSFTFAFGSGLAGMAGCAATLFDKLNPGMGQGYIVDSFMVVVLGGIGKLAGLIVAGGMLGFLNKYIEPWLGAVYGKVALLILVILFLRLRPAGLFAEKGRSADE